MDTRCTGAVVQIGIAGEVNGDSVLLIGGSVLVERGCEHVPRPTVERLGRIVAGLGYSSWGGPT